jgi:hypothetical protein
MQRDVLSAIKWLQGICAAALVGLAIVPTRWVEAGPNVCLVRRLFGVECLGCGMTRGISHLLHGHWRTALAYNRGSAAVMITLLSVALSVLVIPRPKD